MQGQARRHGEGPPELLYQLGIEGWIPEDLLAREVDLVVQVGASGQVQGDVDQDLVQRHADGREAPHARLVPQGVADRLAERYPDVLDRVVGVDLEVAAAADLEPEATMAAQLLQHVVEEGYARLRRGSCTAGATVEVDGDRNLSLPGGALPLTRPVHVRSHLPVFLPVAVPGGRPGSGRPPLRFRS